MEIKIDGYQLRDALSKYINDRLNIDIDLYDLGSTVWVEPKSTCPNLYKYKQDWDWEGNDHVKTAEYDVEGIYVKRKKKGSTKAQYVLLDSSEFIKEFSLDNDEGVSVYIES